MFRLLLNQCNQANAALIEIKIHLNMEFIRVYPIKEWNAPENSNLVISTGNGVGQHTGSSWSCILIKHILQP